MSSLKRDVDEVIAWSRDQIKHPTQDWSGLCQSHCRQAYGVGAWAPSAISAWGMIPRKAKVSGTDPSKAPRGALLYYAGGSYGHVAIAIGRKTHKWCLSNDFVRPGKIDIAPRTFKTPKHSWGVRYLGYSFWVPGGELKH